MSSPDKPRATCAQDDHSFAKFDDFRIFCQKCGEIRNVVENWMTVTIPAVTVTSGPTLTRYSIF